MLKDLGENACPRNTTSVTQKIMSRAQNLNWPFSQQVLSALVTPLGEIPMLIGIGPVTTQLERPPDSVTHGN